MVRKYQFKKFADDDQGAVTVDWVVLTAALVGIGLALLGTIQSGIDQAATDISQKIGDAVNVATSTQ